LSRLSGQSFINSGESVKFSFNVSLFLLVEEDFVELRIVLPNSGSFSNNFSGVNNVLQNLRVNSSESSASGSFEVVVFGGLGQNLSLSDDHDVFSAEFLFELADETKLDLLEVGKESVGDDDDNHFLSWRNFNFFGRGEVKSMELSTKVLSVGLDIMESLSNSELECVRFLVVGFDDFFLKGTHAHCCSGFP